MKKYLSLLFVIVASVAFADNEVYNWQDVSGENFTGSSYKNSSWANCTAVGTIFSSNQNSTDYTGAYFGGANLTNADFTNANLTNVDFDGGLSSSTLTNVNFTGSNLENANLWGEDVSSVNFTDANLTNVTFGHYSGMTNAQLRSASSVKGISIYNIDMTNWDLSNLDLTGARFDNNSIFNNTNLTNAKLTSVNFCLSHLENANFTGADLTSACFYESYGLTDDQLRSAYSVRGIHISFSTVLDFFVFDMTHWDLSKLDLTSASFINVNMTEVDFTGTDLRGAIFKDNMGNPIYHNTIMSDGVIQNMSFVTSKDMLIIRENTDILTKIVDSAILTDGKIIFEDGGFIAITDGVTLTFSDAFEFVVSDGVTNLSELLSMGKDSTIVMSGYTNEEAGSAFSNLFKTEDGSDVYITIEDSFIIKGNVVPEPSTYAIIFGILALSFVVYRRRK